MCPTLAIFGTVDSFMPAADIDALRATWAGRPDCEIVVVEGADHGFIHDPERPVHRADDAAACWEANAGSGADLMRLRTRLDAVLEGAEIAARASSSARSRMWYWLRPDTSSQPSVTNNAIALLTRSRMRRPCPRAPLA